MLAMSFELTNFSVLWASNKRQIHPSQVILFVRLKKKPLEFGDHRCWKSLRCHAFISVGLECMGFSYNCSDEY